MTQIEAAVKLENFLNGSNFLVAHGAVDFTTIRVMLSKTQERPSFERIVKVDSQKFYKSLMWSDHRVTKYGMETIVKYYGDAKTKDAHKAGAHGALCDAEALCSVSTGSLLDRFKDWLMFEDSEEEVMVSRPARSQSVTREVFYPG